MNAGDSRGHEGYDIVINGVNTLFADLEVSAIASAGFHNENYPEDKVQNTHACRRNVAHRV
jgi:hypothetical protein